MGWWELSWGICFLIIFLQGGWGSGSSLRIVPHFSSLAWALLRAVALCRNWTVWSGFLSCECVPVVCGDCSGKDGAETWRMKTMTFAQTAAFLMQWDSGQAPWLDDDDVWCTAARWRVGPELGGAAGRGVHAVLRLPTSKEKKAFLEWSRNLDA